MPSEDQLTASKKWQDGVDADQYKIFQYFQIIHYNIVAANPGTEYACKRTKSRDELYILGYTQFGEAEDWAQCGKTVWEDEQAYQFYRLQRFKKMLNAGGIKAVFTDNVDAHASHYVLFTTHGTLLGHDETIDVKAARKFTAFVGAIWRRHESMIKSLGKTDLKLGLNTVHSFAYGVRDDEEIQADGHIVRSLVVMMDNVIASVVHVQGKLLVAAQLDVERLSDGLEGTREITVADIERLYPDPDKATIRKRSTLQPIAVSEKSKSGSKSARSSEGSETSTPSKGETDHWNFDPSFHENLAKGMRKLTVDDGTATDTASHEPTQDTATETSTDDTALITGHLMKKLNILHLKAEGMADFFNEKFRLAKAGMPADFY